MSALTPGLIVYGQVKNMYFCLSVLLAENWPGVEATPTYDYN